MVGIQMAYGCVHQNGKPLILDNHRGRGIQQVPGNQDKVQMVDNLPCMVGKVDTVV